MMMPQYTAASLVLENRSLATPDSTYSLPTSAAQEDHNANSMTAARHTRQIINNTAHVLAIELYTAARALDIRIREMPHTKLGIGTSAAFRCIRDAVPYQAGDCKCLDQLRWNKQRKVRRPWWIIALFAKY
jgi:histidine ammonia-lyase